jgi:hypothetical protein
MYLTDRDLEWLGEDCEGVVSVRMDLFLCSDSYMKNLNNKKCIDG